MSDEDAVAGDAHSAAVTRAIEIAAPPGTRGGILGGWNGHHPMQMLEVAKQVKLLFEREGAGLGVLLRRERIDLALAVDAHRGHFGEGRVEGGRLTARGIGRVIDARGTGRRRLRGDIPPRRQRTDNHQGRQHSATAVRRLDGHHFAAAFCCSSRRAWKLFSLRSTYALKPAGSTNGLAPCFSSFEYFSAN